MATSPILGIPLVSNQQSQPEVTVNEAILLLQIALMGCIDLGVDTPPTASDGDAYVIGAAPTGLWTGQANKIAIYYNGAWLFLPGVDADGVNIPMGADQKGIRVYNNSDDAVFVWDGSSWVQFAASQSASVRLSADQTSIPYATWTKVAFDTENYDIGGFFDTANNRWTPPAGLIQVSATLQANLLQNFQWALYKNGSLAKVGAQSLSTTDLFLRVGSTVIDRANGTDYYEVWVRGDGTDTDFDLGSATLVNYADFIWLGN